MLRILLLAVFFGATAAGSVLAFDIDAMTEEERAAFRAEIRAYLLDNPDVIMEAVAVLEERQARDEAVADAQMLVQFESEIYDDGFSFVGGNPDGDITIVEFLDYRCGFCKRAFPEMEELLASDGNIRFIVKEFPVLGEASVLGARYAIATKQVEGDEAYKAVHDALMQHRGDISEPVLVRMSSDLGLNHELISSEMEGAFVSEVIAANHQLGQTLQIRGTPSFIMGDTFVRGFIELDQMRAIVEQARENAG